MTTKKNLKDGPVPTAEDLWNHRLRSQIGSPLPWCPAEAPLPP